MPSKIDILITSFHRPDLTRQCIENIHEYTTTPHRCLVVDNGSDQATLDTLWDLKDSGMIDVLVLLGTNEGLEPAKNLGLHFVRSELYCDTDNDIFVPPPTKQGDWLIRLLRLKKRNPEFAAISCLPHVFIGAVKADILRDAPEVIERDFVGGSMRLMDTEAVKAVDGWRSHPKDMYEANRGEERYICGKLKQAGHKVGYARDIEVFHSFGDTEWGYPEEVDHYHRDQWPIPSNKLYGSYEQWRTNNRK